MTTYRELSISSKSLYGSYYSYTGNITKEDIEQYSIIYDKFKDNKLKDNSSINISSLSEFPSYKLKNYINENNLNISITRKVEKINTIILIYT
jgi:hypothetical protein